MINNILDYVCTILYGKNIMVCTYNLENKNNKGEVLDTIITEFNKKYSRKFNITFIPGTLNDVTVIHSNKRTDSFPLYDIMIDSSLLLNNIINE